MAVVWPETVQFPYGVRTLAMQIKFICTYLYLFHNEIKYSAVLLLNGVNVKR